MGRSPLENKSFLDFLDCWGIGFARCPTTGSATFSVRFSFGRRRFFGNFTAICKSCNPILTGSFFVGRQADFQIDALSMSWLVRLVRGHRLCSQSCWFLALHNGLPVLVVMSYRLMLSYPLGCSPRADGPPAERKTENSGTW